MHKLYRQVQSTFDPAPNTWQPLLSAIVVVNCSNPRVRSTLTLSKIARDRYLQNLLCLYNQVGDSSEDCVDRLDPYQLAADQWIDDTSRWPPVEYPDLYSYLIETPGEFTKEKLKAFKSLEAYNYYKRYVKVAACTSPNSQCDIAKRSSLSFSTVAGYTPFIITNLDRITRIAS